MSPFEVHGVLQTRCLRLTMSPRFGIIGNKGLFCQLERLNEEVCKIYNSCRSVCQGN